MRLSFECRAMGVTAHRCKIEQNVRELDVSCNEDVGARVVEDASTQAEEPINLENAVRKVHSCGACLCDVDQTRWWCLQ